MRVLTAKEIDQTAGALGPLGGGLLTAGTYAAMNAISGQEVTFQGLASSFTAGAVTSGFSALPNIARGVAALSGTAKRVNDIHDAGLGVLSGGAVAGMTAPTNSPTDGGSK